LVIDCTTTGAAPPTITPPTSTPTDLRRSKGEEKYPVIAGGPGFSISHPPAMGEAARERMKDPGHQVADEARLVNGGGQ
jgi:hypothetical protein